jgi:hypothetical protein
MFFIFGIDQDEWQHLHTIWSTIRGQLQYRDGFDNHMPLFHMLSQPLAAWVGECSDVVQHMRLFMLPILFLNVWPSPTPWLPNFMAGAAAELLADPEQ